MSYNSCVSDLSPIYLTRLDLFLQKLHQSLFVKHPHGSMAVSIIIYVLVIVFFGTSLEVSSNYFVLLPLTTAALCYGLPGGLIAGFIALPCNIALFLIHGRQDFFPDNLVVAQISGSLLGLICGSLGGYFKRMESEYAARNLLSKRLDAILAEKELMLDEIHHRVRNNLSMIMSLIQLQALDSSSEAFKQAAGLLKQRLMAISLIHQQLYRGNVFGLIKPSVYFRDLVHHICQAQDLNAIQVNLEASDDLPELNIDLASAIGLILNEVITNSVKHAFGKEETERPRIDVRLVVVDGNWLVSVQDNGHGFPCKGAAHTEHGLGLKIIKSLVANLQGESSYACNSGTLFEVSFKKAQ